ncbi:hypothetical protein L228DRAFT_263320 [Xylona heveae TC161]|uniref:ERT1/acuK family PAS domain-containing protein n=1 Tax=Xylona heveae (strain CBS 132557 / TC161) TaxID=1328760 RepID=A0A165A694_XYLHT|nr:hypothetical protein L228DRAFT_263320 [Xylona heveae TC161]KZF20009.1 hypothetical protein L228DRAFT_263320 [Xylona heveae TC161]
MFRRRSSRANKPAVLGYNDWNLGVQDMHNFHPSYLFNAPEMTNEYNLLGDFLSTSLLDDGGMYSADDLHSVFNDPALLGAMATNLGDGAGGTALAPTQRHPAQQQRPPIAADATAATAMMTGGPSAAAEGGGAAAVSGSAAPTGGPASNALTRPGGATAPIDKARETYYMTAADPSGTDAPEERMQRLLKAKYDAGLLKPFNYVKGYARLNQYMERHMQPSSRQKILRQLDKFRPKFRERMQSLTDIELVLVEMWFERSLMEYDRVFASMAIPACCWRRTGEIFRGNREMAELIHVPIESLRDGKLAIHEIIVEEHLVSYWEKFGAIAFDNTQKAMLTSCTLKNPDLNSKDPEIPCCFSFTIRRDTHNIPSIILGNFLPMDPPKR